MAGSSRENRPEHATPLRVGVKRNRKNYFQTPYCCFTTPRNRNNL
jgi:hypothetical protein